MTAINELGFLSKFKGTLVHDCFSMYFNYGKDHAVCNAHLLRELTFIEEKYNYRWAHRVKRFLLDLNDLVNWHRENDIDYLDKNIIVELENDFKNLLLKGRSEC